MAFSEETIDEAYERSGGRCECTRDSCANHYLSRCSARLSSTTAVYHKRKSSGFGDMDRVTNCEVICESCKANAGYDEFARFDAYVR